MNSVDTTIGDGRGVQSPSGPNGSKGGTGLGPALLDAGIRLACQAAVQGDVELVVAGDEDGLTELARSLQRGPRGSRVDRVLEHPLVESEADGLAAFRIEGAW